MNFSKTPILTVSVQRRCNKKNSARDESKTSERRGSDLCVRGEARHRKVDTADDELEEERGLLL